MKEAWKKLSGRVLALVLAAAMTTGAADAGFTVLADEITPEIVGEEWVEQSSEEAAPIEEIEGWEEPELPEEEVQEPVEEEPEEVIQEEIPEEPTQEETIPEEEPEEEAVEAPEEPEVSEEMEEPEETEEAEAEEPEDETEEAEASEEAEESEASAEESAEESAEAAEESAQEEEALPQEKHVITGFVIPENGNQIQASATDRPSLEQLTSLMSDTITVYLDQEETKTEISVAWYCVGGEYEEGTQYYYQFSPKWDTKRYELSDSLDVELDAPDYGVFFGEETGITTLSVTHSANETKTYRYLVENMGLKCAAALGIMANIQSESGYNPNAVNPGSTSFHGICQWGLGGASGNRWSKLKSWCSSHGYSYSSLNGQLRYMRYELENYSGYRYSTLKNVSNTASGAASAARTFAQYFEGCSSIYFASRQRLAKTTYWKEYSGLASAKLQVLNSKNIVYNGKKQEPEVKVTKGGKSLKEGKDYKVSYSDNVKPGEAKVLITGIGGYCGTLMGNFTIQVEVPKLVKADCTSSGVRVKWNAVAGAVKYRLYRKSGSSWKKVTDTSNLSATDPNAVSGKTNVYTVCCISTDGDEVSQYDGEGISVKYLAPPTLKLYGRNKGMRVQWEPVNGASSYRIYRQNDDESWTAVKTTSSTKWTDTSAVVNKTYSYKAVSITEEDALSCESSAVSMKYLPTPVLKSAVGVKNGVTISWDKVPGAEKYRVYCMQKDGSWKKLADTTSTSYKDKKAKSGKTYTYTVCCISKSGKSLQSGYDTEGVSAQTKD